MPVTANVFCSVSVKALYPDLSTAAWISDTDTILSSKLMFNFSVAKFTLDSCTPGNFLVAFSTVCTHDAQVIPSIANVFLVILCHLLFNYLVQLPSPLPSQLPLNCLMFELFHRT